MVRQCRLAVVQDEYTLPCIELSNTGGEVAAEAGARFVLVVQAPPAALGAGGWEGNRGRRRQQQVPVASGRVADRR